MESMTYKGFEIRYCSLDKYFVVTNIGMFYCKFLEQAESLIEYWEKTGRHFDD